MSRQERQKQTEKFVGCILSVKTKPTNFGETQHIIGTVREIDVDSSEQAIVLDQAMSNGEMLPDGYVLLTGQIADLQVMGKASEIKANLESAYSHCDTIKSQESKVHDERKEASGNSNVRPTFSMHAGLNSNASYMNGCESPKIINGNVQGVHLHNLVAQSQSITSSTIMNSIASAVADLAIGEVTPGVLDRNDSNSHTIAKPTPRKPKDGPAYHSSSKERVISSIQQLAPNSGTASTLPIETNCKTSTNTGLSSNNVSGDDGNILLRTFGNLSNAGSNTKSLLNAVGNCKKNGGPTETLKANIVPSPSKLSPQKPMMYDHKKLGVLSQFVNSAEPSASASQPVCEEPQKPAPLMGTPTGKTLNNTQTPRSQTKTTGRQRHGETFESMSKDEMATEFDFEGSNAQFEKLPVNCVKPAKVTKNPPQFSNTDTTYLADRVVESITLRGSVTSTKVFVTDTGVAIPSVDISTRSKILNLAHGAGLTHSRVVEIMGRAVTQAVIPLLGDSYRLSPEREEDRPWVLVCAGPHWQGAIGIAAARILASLGVHTCVHSPKEELQLCATEEVLYNLSGEMFSRHSSDFKGIQFDLVIMAMDDHLTRSLTLAPYQRWLKKCPVVFVDPPLISSYRQQLELISGSGGGAKGRKIVIVSPVLPLAYPTDFSVKIFLVNLGIPNEIFQRNDVIYKSPFGDKLVTQIFSCSSK